MVPTFLKKMILLLLSRGFCDLGLTVGTNPPHKKRYRLYVAILNCDLRNMLL